MSDDSLQYDVLIVGAGPAGLACAIRLKQIKPELQVLVLEKASVLGGQVVSGAVLDPSALNELLPNWRELNPPVHTPVSEDRCYLLTSQKAFALPVPRPMQNHGNIIISLSQWCRFLGAQAEALGVEIFPGFAAVSLLYDAEGSVVGVKTGDLGVSKEGIPGPQYQSGVSIHAKYTVLAEGVRGSLSKEVLQRFELYPPHSFQTYAIGIKELWKIPKEKHKKGLVLHTLGWPLDTQTYGGSFLYHWGEEWVSLGLVVGLDYENPYLSPFEEFQRLKSHPKIQSFLEGGERLSYGARALNEGGFQSVPHLVFPGGLLVGCAAGMVNVPRIKGIHNAMHSGMLAANAMAEALSAEHERPLVLHAYQSSWSLSGVAKELWRARNIRPAFRWGFWQGLLHAALDTYVFRGCAPWTFKHHAPDHTRLLEKNKAKPIDYPKPDGVYRFDRLSSVYLANLSHPENQPSHLHLRDASTMAGYNWEHYDSPETRYCPAGVYEVVMKDGKRTGVINAQNCVHCKTCDIKDPTQNITWVPPEGGSGPNYQDL